MCVHTVKLERRPLGEEEISRENGEGSQLHDIMQKELSGGDKSVGSAMIPVCVEVP